MRPRWLLPVTSMVASVAMTVAIVGCADAERDQRFAAVVVPSQTGDPADELHEEVTSIPADERPTTVVMVGDSITVAAAEHLEFALTGLGLDVLVVDAQVGRRMTVGERDRLMSGTEAIELISDDHEAELWIVALGTNDIGQYPDVDRIRDEVDSVLREIPSDAVVVWVDTWIRSRPDQARAVNQAIREVVESRNAAIVIDWATPATGEGVLSGDGVHLTDGVGRARFAEVVASGVEALIGPAP